MRLKKALYEYLEEHKVVRTTIDILLGIISCLIFVTFVFLSSIIFKKLEDAILVVLSVAIMLIFSYFIGILVRFLILDVQFKDEKE